MNISNDQKAWRTAYVAGALLACLAVGLGAIGTHSLEQVLPKWFADDSPRRLAAWHSAVLWQMVHALTLVAIGLSRQRISEQVARALTAVFVIAIVLFSFCIYAWVLSGIGFFVGLVPVGGILFMLGWVVLAVSALKFPGHPDTT